MAAFSSHYGPAGSWARSAREYVALYEEAIERRKNAKHLEPLIRDLPPEPIEIELPELAEIPVLMEAIASLLTSAGLSAGRLLGREALSFLGDLGPLGRPDEA